jgi:hypothetical protein
MVARRSKIAPGPSSNWPLAMLMPLSSWNTAFSPPPRSSTPRKPQRDVFLPPETRRVAPPSLLAWFTYSTPASTMPYKVTLDCACAPAANPASPAQVTPTAAFFMLHFINSLRWLVFLLRFVACRFQLA